MIAAKTPSRANSLPAGLFAKVTIQELLGEFYTSEFQKLSVFLESAVEGHADLPGAREHLGVFDRGLVLNHVGPGRRISLDDVKRVAVKVPGAVEPRLIVERRHVDHQRVSFP